MVFILMPVVGAIIGWITNRLAIRLLFRPLEPWPRGWRFAIWGVIPKRRDDLAKSIAKAVKEDLLPLDAILESANFQALRGELVQIIWSTGESWLREKIPSPLRGILGGSIQGGIKDWVSKEIEPALDQILAQAQEKIVQRVDLAEIVEREVAGWDLAEVEDLALRIAGRELAHLEVLGAVLGGLIGLIQAGLWVFLG